MQPHFYELENIFCSAVQSLENFQHDTNLVRLRERTLPLLFGCRAAYFEFFAISGFAYFVQTTNNSPSGQLSEEAERLLDKSIQEFMRGATQLAIAAALIAEGQALSGATLGTSGFIDLQSAYQDFNQARKQREKDMQMENGYSDGRDHGYPNQSREPDVFEKRDY